MENETKTVKDLQDAAYNPRTISKSDFKSLEASIKRWGDLSGIVRNNRTGNLVGGHQRKKAFIKAGNPPIEITEKLPEPNSVGTVARGYVLLGDEKFTYREVDWDIHNEEAANIAANRIAGEFDSKRLAELTKDLVEFDADLAKATGLSDAETNSLIKSLNEEQKPKSPKPTGDQTLSFELTSEEAQKIDAALFKAKGDSDMSDGQALIAIAETYLNGKA